MAIFGFKSRSCFIDLVPTQPRLEGDWVVSPPTHDGLYAIVGQVPGWRCISPSCLGHEQSIAAKASITYGKGWVGRQSSLRAMKLVICKMQVQQTKHIASKIYPIVWTCKFRRFNLCRCAPQDACKLYLGCRSRTGKGGWKPYLCQNNLYECMGQYVEIISELKYIVK